MWHFKVFHLVNESNSKYVVQLTISFLILFLMWDTFCEGYYFILKTNDRNSKQVKQESELLGCIWIKRFGLKKKIDL